MPAPRRFYLYEIRKRGNAYYPTVLLEESTSKEVIQSAMNLWRPCQEEDPDMQFLVTVTRLLIY